MAKPKDNEPLTVVVDGRNVIDLFEWQAYKLKETEFRLGGFYRGHDGNIRVVITEPVAGIDAPFRLARTEDGNWYRLNATAKPDQKMNLMYEVTQWATRNVRRTPTDATNIIEEHLLVDASHSTPEPEVTKVVVTNPGPTGKPVDPILLTEDDIVVDVDAEVESTVEVMEATPVDETLKTVEDFVVVVDEADENTKQAAAALNAEFNHQPVKKKRRPRSDKGKPRPQMRKENRQ
jgi:hypothetical protein